MGEPSSAGSGPPVVPREEHGALEPQADTAHDEKPVLASGAGEVCGMDIFTQALKALAAYRQPGTAEQGRDGGKARDREKGGQGARGAPAPRQASKSAHAGTGLPPAGTPAPRKRVARAKKGTASKVQGAATPTGTPSAPLLGASPGGQSLPRSSPGSTADRLASASPQTEPARRSTVESPPAAPPNRAQADDASARSADAGVPELAATGRPGEVAAGPGESQTRGAHEAPRLRTFASPDSVPENVVAEAPVQASIAHEGFGAAGTGCAGAEVRDTAFPALEASQAQSPPVCRTLWGGGTETVGHGQAGERAEDSVGEHSGEKSDAAMGQRVQQPAMEDIDSTGREEGQAQINASSGVLATQQPQAERGIEAEAPPTVVRQAGTPLRPTEEELERLQPGQVQQPVEPQLSVAVGDQRLQHEMQQQGNQPGQGQMPPQQLQPTETNHLSHAQQAAAAAEGAAVQHMELLGSQQGQPQGQQLQGPHQGQLEQGEQGSVQQMQGEQLHGQAPNQQGQQGQGQLPQGAHEGPQQGPQLPRTGYWSRLRLWTLVDEYHRGLREEDIVCLLRCLDATSMLGTEGTGRGLARQSSLEIIDHLRVLKRMDDAKQSDAILSPGLAADPVDGSSLLASDIRNQQSQHVGSSGSDQAHEAADGQTEIVGGSVSTEVEAEVEAALALLRDLGQKNLRRTRTLLCKTVPKLQVERRREQQHKRDLALVVDALAQQREAKRQGRKERREREAQAVLAAATAAVAASPRLTQTRRPGQILTTLEGQEVLGGSHGLATYGQPHGAYVLPGYGAATPVNLNTVQPGHTSRLLSLGPLRGAQDAALLVGGEQLAGRFLPAYAAPVPCSFCQRSGGAMWQPPGIGAAAGRAGPTSFWLHLSCARAVTAFLQARTVAKDSWNVSDVACLSSATMQALKHPVPSSLCLPSSLVDLLNARLPVSFQYVPMKDIPE